MLCLLGHHRVDPATTFNGGIGFSRCLTCGVELVRRSGARWARVPRGYAVVWRPVADRPALAADHVAPRSAIARMSARAWRAIDGAAPAMGPVSRDYRYLARQVDDARTLLLSALCDAAVANDAMLMIAAMVQDERGGRVLMIDATLGGDGVSAALDMGGRPGLSDIVAGDPWSAVEVMQMLARPDMILLGAGRQPGAGRPDLLVAMLPFLAERFDHILIQQRDIRSDSRNLTLAACADQVWLLAEEGRSPMAGLHGAREAFCAHGIAQVGLILTVPSTGGAHGG